MTVNGHTLTDGQRAVYTAMRDWKRPIPDHALVPLVQHVAGYRMSSSGIRTRRSELSRMGLLKEAQKTVKMPSGRHAKRFRVV